MNSQDRDAVEGVGAAPTATAEWCAAGGSEDAYRIMSNADEVRCFVCGRYLFLTRLLRLPAHKTQAVA